MKEQTINGKKYKLSDGLNRYCRLVDLGQQVIEVLQNYKEGQMTYVIKNTIRETDKKVSTREVYNNLLKLEKLNKVQRTDSSYAKQICWKLV